MEHKSDHLVMGGLQINDIFKLFPNLESQELKRNIAELHETKVEIVQIC